MCDDMADNPRLNKVISLLEEGKPVFGTLVNNGNIDELVWAADAGYDFVGVETEHLGLDFPNLRISLQFLLNRRKIAAQDSLQADPTPFVRISPNTAEIKVNQWAIKQSMDQGAYGLILPRVESVEAAKAAVVACRYVQRLDAADASPRGERGWDPRVAAPYWGISVEEYTELSDLWPLDPDGELLLMAMCETGDGVKNLPAILREVKGIGVVWAATGDMAVSLGVGPDRGHPLVEEAILSTVKTCQEYGVPCAVVANTSEDLDMRLEQGFQLFFAIQSLASPVLSHGLKVAKR